MGDVTAIEWADRTFNPWEGCQKVGPGCDNCYAETRNARWNGGEATNWGPGAPRRRTSAANWRKPIQWDKQAAKDIRVAKAGGIPPPPPVFVFCASLADVFDNAVPAEWRRDLFDMIRATPNLTWLLLTKRPGNIVKLFDEVKPAPQSKAPLRHWWPSNAAIGCTVVNQEEANRDIPKLLQAKEQLNPAFAFLSMEPLLGPVDLRNVATMAFRGAEFLDALTGELRGMFGDPCRSEMSGVDWVIVGGESGPKARPLQLFWVRSLLLQTGGTKAVFNFKQVGGRGADKGGHELDGRLYLGRPAP